VSEILAKQIATFIAGDIVLSDEPGRRMRYWREYFGVSQSEVATKMSTLPSVISDYESCRRKSPGSHFIKRFVEALITIDLEKGGRKINELASVVIGVSSAFRRAVLDMREFTKPITIGEFCSVIDAELHVGREFSDVHIYGYTVVDSMKLVLEVPSYEYLRLYGRSTQRAAIFTNVRYGRSPLVAIKAMMAISGLRPVLVVLHGIKEPDELGIEIAKRESIPLATTLLPLTDMIKKLRGV